MKNKLILPVLAILLGVFVFVYGGSDDSPGAQLLGVVLVVFGIWKIVKNRKKDFTPTSL